MLFKDHSFAGGATTLSGIIVYDLTAFQLLKNSFATLSNSLSFFATNH
jgi:hypothetical protein